MTIIEQIKAEIKRRIRELDEQIVDIYDSKAVLRKDELQRLLSFISTLESENPMSQEGLEKAVVDYFEGYWPGMETAEQCNTDLHFTPPAIMRLARHFAQWGAEHCGSLGTMVSGWMARDRNGHLNFFLAEPRRFTNVRGEEYWIGHARMKMPNEFLPELSWSNEPIKVKLKVEKYESSKS